MRLKNIDKTLFEKLTILYVEDDTNTREEVSFFLKRVVNTLYTAENGQEGLKVFQEHKFDMVITDIQMPVMNGLEMVKAIREINSHVPVAVTTAFSDTDFLIKAIECGVDKYIIKPIDMTEMAAVIQKCTKYGYMQLQIQEYDYYSKYILNQNSSFMFILHDGEPKYANNSFDEALGVTSFQELYNTALFFLEGNQFQQQQNWIEYIQAQNKPEYIVTLRKSRKKYCLKYKHFGEIKKSVFSFREIDDAKLQAIVLREAIA